MSQNKEKQARIESRLKDLKEYSSIMSLYYQEMVNNDAKGIENIGLALVSLRRELGAVNINEVLKK